MQRIPELARHVDALCVEYDITIEVRVSSGGRAFAKERRIHIKPVKSMITYFTALHEIGHIVHPKGSGRSRLRLEKEYYAWDWAIEAAQVDPNDAVKRMIHRCLTSYIKKVEVSRMRMLPTEHPMWDLIREMEKG